ncbi:Amidase signature domain containing protein [Amanita muscaria]
MIFSFSAFAHQRACAWKQRERQSQIASLPAEHSEPLSLSEQKFHALSIAQLVSQCRSGIISPPEVMLAYSKKALRAHRATNCISDFMFNKALAIPSVANWVPGVDPDNSISDSDMASERSLMGVPVSIKDTIDIAGHDSTISFSRNVNKPATKSSSIVRLLQDSGALILAKTTVPTGLLSIETYSDLFGQTTNPYSRAHTPGGSTGGGAALLACGGSKVEIGTDLAGSARIPAHFCGLWSLKGSFGRFPSWGSASSLPGAEGVPILAAPMAGSLEDLSEFWKRVIMAKPWLYDHTCIPMLWKDINLQDEGRKLKWGVIWEDGTIPPTPATRRALSMVITALKRQGHEVVDFNPPDVYHGLKLGYRLLFGDGGQQIRETLLPSETLNASAMSVLNLLALPRLLKTFLARLTRSTPNWFRRLFGGGDHITADFYHIMQSRSVYEERQNIHAREEYRAAWHEKWISEGIDFVLTVPHAFPALRHNASEKTTLMSAGYTFIFSLLDYTAGILPVTFVDRASDALPSGFFSSEQYLNMNSVARLAYTAYDAEDMHGLPLGVQVVGKRLEEEKVLEGMKIIEAALAKQGHIFVPGNLPTSSAWTDSSNRLF